MSIPAEQQLVDLQWPWNSKFVLLHSWQSIVNGQFIHLTSPCHPNSLLRHLQECLSPWWSPFCLFLPANSILSVMPFVKSPWLTLIHSTNMYFDKSLTSCLYQTPQPSISNSLATHCIAVLKVSNATAAVCGCLLTIVKQNTVRHFTFSCFGEKICVMGVTKTS